MLRLPTHLTASMLYVGYQSGAIPLVRLLFMHLLYRYDRNTPIVFISIDSTFKKARAALSVTTWHIWGGSSFLIPYLSVTSWHIWGGSSFLIPYLSVTSWHIWGGSSFLIPYQPSKGLWHVYNVNGATGEVIIMLIAMIVSARKDRFQN